MIVVRGAAVIVVVAILGASNEEAQGEVVNFNHHQHAAAVFCNSICSW